MSDTDPAVATDENKEFDEFFSKARRYAPFSIAGDEAALSFLKMVYTHELPPEPAPPEPVAAAPVEPQGSN